MWFKPIPISNLQLSASPNIFWKLWAYESEVKCISLPMHNIFFLGNRSPWIEGHSGRSETEWESPDCPETGAGKDTRQRERPDTPDAADLDVTAAQLPTHSASQ